MKTKEIESSIKKNLPNLTTSPNDRGDSCYLPANRHQMSLKILEKKQVVSHLKKDESVYVKCLLNGFEKSLPSEGCSNPESTIARSSSGFKRKSLNPEL